MLLLHFNKSLIYFILNWHKICIFMETHFSTYVDFVGRRSCLLTSRTLLTNVDCLLLNINITDSNPIIKTLHLFFLLYVSAHKLLRWYNMPWLTLGKDLPKILWLKSVALLIWDRKWFYPILLSLYQKKNRTS